MLQSAWRIELFGGLRAVSGSVEITRFRSQRTGLLLASLAHHPGRAQPRETLVELLWPEAEPELGRMSLRTALASLRRQLEPPGTLPGSVLVATRSHVRLAPAAVETDVAEFEAARRAARSAPPAERENLLRKALDCYRGPLLPGYYEDWVLAERERLETEFVEALCELTRLLAGDGMGAEGLRDALERARQAVSLAPLREEPRMELVRLSEAMGQPGEALRHYEELERILSGEFDMPPSPAARAAGQRLRAEVGRTSHAKGRLGAPPCRRPVPAAAKRASPHPEALAAPSSPSAPVRLPPSLNRFFGREAELARLVETLSSEPGEAPAARLVTITGPGGTGKTRLAVEAAHRLAGPGGRWFVSLADIDDPGLIPGAVLDAMGLSRAAGLDPFDQVASALSGSAGLLVLDNYEQLTPAGAPTIQSLLARAPGVTCVVTSRRRLALPGERQIPVPPLPIPSDPVSPEIEEPEALLRYPGVQLFADRAQAVCPDFQVTRGNARAVAALCHRLEGIPLAIELAAARAQALTPAQMLQRLAEPAPESAPLLAARRTREGGRHSSLWAAIDWSYQLLTPEQRRFFVRLAVFRGGCSPEAAAEICEAPEALEYLAQLRERSLVVGEEAAGVGAASSIRFRLLESLREYGWEQLSSDERDELQRRHAAFFQQLAARAEPELMGPGQVSWLARLQTEHDNLRAAIAWAAAGGEPRSECALRLAGSLFRFWLMRGFLIEGRGHLAHVLSHASTAPTFARAKALNAAGVLAQHQGDSAVARELYLESLAICRQIGDRKYTAALLGNLGTLAYRQSDYLQARELLEESTSIRREIDDRWGVANNLNVLANVAGNQGLVSEAETYYEESLALFREVGDGHNVALVLGNQGSLAERQGDDARARRLQEEALAVYRELGDREDVVLPLANLADIALRTGEHEAASRYLSEGLAIAREAGSRPRIATLLSRQGSLALETGDLRSASAHFRESLTLYREIGNKQSIAVLLEALAHLTTREGRSDARRAAVLFGAAHALRAQIGAPHSPADEPDHNSRLAAARALAAPADWAAGWAEGEAMSPDQAVEAALLP